MTKNINFIGSIWSLTFVLFFLNDLNGLLRNPKWDGLLHFLCNKRSLILIDKIALLLCGLIFCYFATKTIKHYHWKFLYVPLIAGIIWLGIMLLHLGAVFIFFI